MATYAPIPTGYVDDGPLGALWAGQNAAAQRDQNEMSNLADMMDLMTKGQTYDQTARMDPERLRQLQFTNTGLDLGNQLAARKLPNEGLMSDVQGLFAREQLNTPGWARGKLAGEMAESQGKVTDQTYKADTLVGRVAGENATNQGKQIDYAKSLLPSMRGMNPLQMVDFMQSRNVAPDVAKAYIELIQSKGGIDKLLDNMSRTPASAAAERLQKQQDDAAMARTISQGNASITAARENAKGAIATGNKMAQTAVIQQARLDFDRLKLASTAVDESLDKYKDPSKRGPEYDALIKQRDELAKQMKETGDIVKLVTDHILGDIKPSKPTQPFDPKVKDTTTPAPGAAGDPWITGPDMVRRLRDPATQGTSVKPPTAVKSTAPVRSTDGGKTWWLDIPETIRDPSVSFYRHIRNPKADLANMSFKTREEAEQAYNTSK